MSIQSVNVNDILIDDSRFSLNDYLFDLARDQTCQVNSFDTLGILYPIILYKDDKKQLHLIDGKKRVRFALLSNESMIRATVLPESTPITELIILILCNKKHEIASSVLNRLQFVYFANSLNAPESWIQQSICIPFEFKPYREFFRECERIFNMPKALKLFCHEKKFSFKQLLNLSYHPRDLITQILQWRSSLHLTASTLDEITSNLRDYLKKENRSLKDFIADDEIQELFDSSLNPREKTEAFRKLLYIKRFPVLSETNNRIIKTVSNLNLPKEVRVNWDCTLENKNVNVSLNIKDPDQWQSTLKSIDSEEFIEAIKAVLREL